MVQLAATFSDSHFYHSGAKIQHHPGAVGRLLFAFSVPGVQMHTAFLESERNGPGQKGSLDEKHSALPDAFRLWAGFADLYHAGDSSLLLILVITIGINNI